MLNRVAERCPCSWAVANSVDMLSENFFARVKRFAIPLLKRGAQFLLPRLIKTGTEIMSDVSQGQKVKDAFKSRVPGAIKDAASDFFRQSGSGLRKRNVKRKKAVRHAPLKRLKL